MRIKTKEDRRDRIKLRIRKRVRGTTERPRLTVFRSVTHIYVQVVNDAEGTTIASASSLEPIHAIATGYDPQLVVSGDGRWLYITDGSGADERLAIDLLRDAYSGNVDVTLRTRSSPFWGVEVATQVQLA